MLKLGLRTKLIAASLLVLAPVLALLVQNYRTAYDTQRQQVLADQTRVAQMVSLVVDDALDHVLAMSRSYATDPVVMTLDRARIDPYLARLAPLYPEYEAAVAVFDANGESVGSSTVVSAPVNVADRDWFKAVMQRNQPVLTGVLISRATGRPIVGGAAPIHDQTGRIVGVATSTLDMQRLSDTIQGVRHEPDQHIFVVDRTGTLAFETGESGLAPGAQDFMNYSPVVAALDGKTFTSERLTSLHGDDRMVAALPTPKYGWVVGVSTPVSVALGPVEASLRNTLLVFVAVVAITIGIALGLFDLLARPLGQLTAQAVALGRGDLQHRVQISTGDELEQLGATFNAMADEVQRALQLREEFISVASHELRTPLTVIKGYSQWLTIKETDAERHKALDVVIKQVDRMSELLDEMLTVTEMKAGLLEFHKERTELGALVKDVTDRMQTLAAEHRLIFRGLSDGRAAIIEVDRNQIEVVLTNLIDNAVRYSPHGGDVETEIAVDDAKAIVSVRDHGMGIPEDKRQHVFEPFFQLQPAIAGYGGMGLGLFISKRIIERHGGQIRFETEEGQGSMFSFTLPLAPV